MSAHVSSDSLEQLQQELVTCQRRASLGMLASIMAHEYNNLMTPIVARAHDALARDDIDAMRKALTLTARQTEKALEFTRQVLHLADGRETPLQTCRVIDLVQAALLSAVRPLEKDGIELELHVPADLRVRAQPLLFEQVLLNLLLNARAAMKGRCGKLTISAAREGNMVAVAVRDGGTGIAAERLENVINPFLAADAGTHCSDWSAVGLGLHACRAIVQQHGGTIRAEANSDGPGCTFRFHWPAG